MRTLSYILLLLIPAGLLTACDSNPVDGDGSGHIEAFAVDLVMNGTTIVEVAEGEVKSGRIEVHEGEETSLIHTRFYDEEGNAIDIDDLDESAFSLQVEVTDPDVAEIEQHEGEDWSFHVVGKAAGTTSIVVKVMHNGHADFETPGIPVEVEHAQGEATGKTTLTLCLLHNDHADVEAPALPIDVQGS